MKVTSFKDGNSILPQLRKMKKQQSTKKPGLIYEDISDLAEDLEEYLALTFVHKHFTAEGNAANRSKEV